MADTERINFVRILQLFVPIAGVSVALAALLLGLSARKKELTVAYLGSENVVSPEAGGVHTDIKIDFRGQSIKSLVKIRFAVRNTGAGAIKVDDVKEPVQLSFPKEVKLLSTFLERTAPSDFFFRPNLQSEGNNSIVCDFLLLNSGDEAYFSSYLYDSQPKKPQLRGRIVDVHTIRYVDESQAQAPDPFPFVTSRGPRKVLYWSILCINGALTMLFLGLLVWFSLAYARELLWKKKWMPSFREIIKKVESEPPLDLKELPADARALPLHRWGAMFLSLPIERRVAVFKRAAEQGIPPPPRPESVYGDWKEFFQGTIVFLGFLLVFAVCSVFIYNSPRG